MKNDFEQTLFKLMNNTPFRKAMKNVWNLRDVKLVTTKARRNYLMSEATIIQQKFCDMSFFAIEIKRTQILMNRSAYLGLSKLKLSKIVMHEFL